MGHCYDSQTPAKIPRYPFMTASPERNIFRDPRLRLIAWCDLVHLSKREILFELLLPASWLTASLFAARRGLYFVALGLSFIFFLTGLRVVHNAFHAALGLSAAANHAVLFLMSVAMLGSMHAVMFNHHRHHRLTMGEGDVEGRAADMPAGLVVGSGISNPAALDGIAGRCQAARGSRSGIADECCLDLASLRGFACKRAPLSRRRHGGWPMPHGIFRCLDGSSPLRPHTLHRPNASESHKGPNHFSYVPTHRAPSVSACADLSSSGAITPY